MSARDKSSVGDHVEPLIKDIRPGACLVASNLELQSGPGVKIRGLS